MKRKSLLFVLLMALFMPFALHAQQSLPYSCGFEDDDDTEGWALYATNQDYTGLYNNESYAHSGTHAIGIYYSEQNGYLVSPILTGGDNGINVSFWYYEISQQYGDEQFEVGYTTDESVEDPSEFTYDGDVVTASMEWQQYSFSFPAGTKRIAVHYIFNDALILFLDDFEFSATGAAVCNRPTGLTANNVGSRTATISWTSDASAWQICVNDDEAHLINVNQTTYTLNSLTPETEYTVKVRTNCGNNNFSAWANVSFTTEVACPAPEDLNVADITATSASVSWVSNNSVQLRYRVAPAGNDFEDGTLGAWTTIDADGDGNDWYSLAIESIPGHDGSVGHATSASYASSVLTPDNYLVSPRITFGGSISFYACAQDSAWASEHFGVAISTNGNTDPNDFVTIQEWTMTYEGTPAAKTQGLWGLYTVDLSAYSGQGYVAIRHFNCSDWFRLNVDDITIVQPGVTEPQPWTTVNNNVTNPYALTGLSPETTYQVQVRSNCTSNNDGYSVWTSTTFTTLPSCVAPANLTITNITTTGATITWTGSASSYNLKVNGQVYNNVTSPYNLRNLTSATVYTVEVQSICSATSTSSWTSTEFVTDFCEEADKCELTFVLTDSYGDGWNGGYIDVIDVATNMSIANMAALNHDSGGESTDTFTLAVCNGRNIRFAWHKGSWDSETSYTVYDVNGDEIFSGSGNDFSNDAVISTYTVHCFSSCRKPTNLQATEITANSVTLSWTENGEATAWMVWYSSGVRPTQVTVTETTATINVNPETSYTVRVRPICDVNDKWSDDLLFTTPATCPLPSDITVETETTSATLSWTGSVDSYNIHYRPATAACFDDGTLGDWTTIDADGDGNTWYALDVIPGHNESAGLATSASYTNGALTPDNYLVSPQVTLGGSISFYAGAQDASWPSEHFGVAISTTGNTDAADFTTIAEWTMNADGTGTEGPAKAQGDWGLFTVDLSDYAGQTGYVAIRHFDCTDMFRLNVDDITIIQPGVEIPWNTLSTTETTITLPNLQMGTTYEYQMQSVCAGTPTAWSATNYFTTMDGNVFITDGDWNNGNDWTGGAVPEEGGNVIIRANVTIPAGYTAVADQITIDGGSITVADGGQLYHNTEDLEVTMMKNVTAYTGAKDNYKLLAFPFSDYPDVPEYMTITEGNDFYKFKNEMTGEEWQNKHSAPFTYVSPGYGYLYANPSNIELSMTGLTFISYYNYLTMNIAYNADENGDNSGWALIGNPFVCEAYIYGQTYNEAGEAADFFPMDVMYYDANGDMQTLSAGPVAPMQGFFVRVTENTRVYFVSYELEEDAKSLPTQAQVISLNKMDKPVANAISFDKSANKNVTVVEKKADKTFIVLDKTMAKKFVSKDANIRFKNVIQFKPIKK